jgi:hypothetical protein
MPRKANLAEKLAKIACTDPDDIAELTPEQLSALHMCKHEVLAAVYRLYMVVPPPAADRLFGQQLSQALDKSE